MKTTICTPSGTEWRTTDGGRRYLVAIERPGREPRVEVLRRSNVRSVANEARHKAALARADELRADRRVSVFLWDGQRREVVTVSRSFAPQGGPP